MPNESLPPTINYITMCWTPKMPETERWHAELAARDGFWAPYFESEFESSDDENRTMEQALNNLI